ncbi:2Fe-2S iron-sulfur cluster binding domain-containing protein [Massilia sp. PAMC28688]|uniref:2Fe-2S iron-sulfur cluster-binding protein n=1 Tax=Massilia sp. PAMC28688 TaxID=2861283 RepID=UPI001C633CCE|nr:2Fe-2S iron-sulfur cluster-binding protein [Massilia sp. PAMC28688]QYF93652.1 2Fe-2S iron-sulfur cluster binding domain-containing protein [Massilia sp. PAMC28688]
MSSFEVRVLPAGWTFTAACGESLLASAERAGIVLPSSCRNGSCRTCLARVCAGTARHEVPWPGLSREEKEAGWILPCVAVPLEALELEAPAARRLP